MELCPAQKESLHGSGLVGSARGLGQPGISGGHEAGSVSALLSYVAAA